MTSERLRVLRLADVSRRAAADAAADVLRSGGILVYPTETVYGFGCAVRTDALQRLATLKGREPDKPFLLLVKEPAQADALEWTPAARALAATFWPGPLTLVLRAADGASVAGVTVPPELIGPGGGVGVRASPHPLVAAIIDAMGGPVTSTSANRPGERPARTGDEAAAAARAMLAARPVRCDVLVLDGGPLPPSAPSTVVDCTPQRPRVLRSGALPNHELRQVVADIDV